MGRILFVGIAVAMLLCRDAGALTIDNFEEGPFSLEVTLPGSGGITDQVSSGGRVIGIDNDGGFGTVTAVQEAGGQEAQFSVPIGGAGVLVLNYLPTGVDFTDGGGATGILVTLPQVSNDVRIEIRAGDSSVISEFVEVASGAGSFFFHFSEWSGVDFTDVDELVVRLRSNQGGNYAIADIRTIPEPTTALLLACGLVGLAVRRRAC